MQEWIIRITVNPYVGEMRFEVSKDEGKTWEEVQEENDLYKFQDGRWIFGNCADIIVETIEKYYSVNSTVLIQFIGTEHDYKLLQTVIQGKAIKAKQIASLVDADDAIQIIKGCYGRIKEVFEDYFEDSFHSDDRLDLDICENIRKYDETIKPIIPICVLGSYSAGKSAFVNALIGEELLPSRTKPETARNTLVVRDDERSGYGIRIDYNANIVDISIDYDGEIQIEGLKDDDELYKRVMGIQQNKSSNQAIVHEILELLNSRGPDDTLNLVDSLKKNIILYCPFSNSLLDPSVKYQIYDTPGSNSGKDTSNPAEKLSELMNDQTNALPILMLKLGDASSNDSLALREMLEAYKNGFNLNNMLVVVAMADTYGDSQLREGIVGEIRTSLPNAPILNVSSVLAIGVKKTETDWIDTQYKDGYISAKRKIEEKEIAPLPKYNSVFENSNYDQRTDIDSYLYASGIPDLEYQINCFIKDYANYRKCTNGKSFLVSSLRKAQEKQQKLLNTLNCRYEEKKNEQRKKKEEIIKKLREQRIPPVNSIIKPVKKQYEKVVDQYCEGIESTMKSEWKRCNGKMSDFNKAMRKDCQEKLYVKTYEPITLTIDTEIRKLVKQYMEAVSAIINNKSNSFTEECIKKLGIIMEEQNKKVPSFSDTRSKNLTANLVILFSNSILRKNEKIDSLWYKTCAKVLVDEIKGTSGGIFGIGAKQGAFSKDCIREPIHHYNKSLQKWRDDYIEVIESSIDTENDILSSLEKEIKELENQMNDLDTRLDRLKDVSEALEKLFDIKETA